MGAEVLRRFAHRPVAGRLALACWLFVSLAASIVILHWTVHAGAPSQRDASVFDPVNWFHAVRTTFVELWLVFALALAGAAIGARARGARAVALLVVLGLLGTFVFVVNFASAATLPAFGVTPNVGMLLLSDMLFSQHGRTAVISWVPPELWAAAASCIAISLAAALVLWRSQVLRRALIAAALVAGAGLSVLAAIAAFEGRLAEKSPTITFVQSLHLLGKGSPLGQGAAAEPVIAGVEVAAVPIDREAAGRIRNVVVVVLESVSARYLETYGGRYEVTPAISRLAGSGLLFDNAYANAVSSVGAMRTVLSSTYPDVSVYQPEPARPMLPEVLERAGWRTALFHSSDNRYGETQGLLEAAGFGETRDYRDRSCNAELLEDRSEFNSLGTTDECTFDELKRWIAGHRDGPFMAVLWTFQTHYPYFTDRTVAPVELDPGDLADEPLRRAMKRDYLTALRSADRQIGLLMDFLRETGLDATTLVVILGDHGEAFGQHGVYAHGGDLFEENVHVPLLLVFPGLSTESRAERPTSHIDLAPSIADLLGLEAPPGWQGQSVFRPGPKRPILFSTPWIDLVAGYRLDDRKVVARLTRNSAAAYDLAADPGETRDLLAGDPAAQQAEIERLLQWLRWINASADQRESRR